MDLHWFQKKSTTEIRPEDRLEKLPELIDVLNDKYGAFDYSKDARSVVTAGELGVTLAALINKIPREVEAGRLSVLIAGANSGTEVIAFEGFDITALDLSDIALKKIGEKYPEVKTVQGDIQSLPFPDKAFDLYVCLRAIHSSNLDIQ